MSLQGIKVGDIVTGALCIMVQRGNFFEIFTTVNVTILAPNNMISATQGNNVALGNTMFA